MEDEKVAMYILVELLQSTDCHENKVHPEHIFTKKYQTHHNSKYMLMFGLMVQSFCCKDNTSSRIQPEPFQTDWIRAALKSINQLILLILICGTNLQNYCFRKCVFWDTNFIFWF